MTRLAANLTKMFNELPFLERFDAAAKAGFKAVECVSPYEAWTCRQGSRAGPSPLPRPAGEET